MKSSVFRIGAFTVAGLVLTVLALVAAGGNWFLAKETALMRFDSSVYGLQTGAPVVFLGVRLGQVARVGLAPAGPDGITVPVQAELDRELLLELLGEPVPMTESALTRLVARGLVANLATQSLLTGQLYINLDLVERQQTTAAVPLATDTLRHGVVVVPTVRSRLQTLQAQLEQLDVAQIGQDLASAAAATRKLLADPDTQQMLKRSAAAATALEQLVAQMAADWKPLAAQARAALASTDNTAKVVGTNAQALGEAVQPVLSDIRATAGELQRTATALRDTVATDSALSQHATRTLQEIAQSARALRTLAETLEQHPDALLKGRQPPP